MFDDALLEQLELLPDIVRARRASPPRRRPATRRTTSSRAAAQAWPGEVLVATSDRDAFQLVSDRVTILQPVKGVSELARIGPAEVRERYGVEPGAGARPDRAARRPVRQAAGRPRRRPEDGGGRLLQQYGSLEAALAAGRFAAEAEDLRLYRRIATMDASAPLPPLEHQTPTWAEASSFLRELGMDQTAERLAEIVRSTS